MSANLEDLAIALQAAVESCQDAAMLLKTALAVIEGHELGATTLPEPILSQALALLIQEALLDAECGRDLVQVWGEHLAAPISENPPRACRSFPVKAAA